MSKKKHRITKETKFGSISFTLSTTDCSLQISPHFNAFTHTNLQSHKHSNYTCKHLYTQWDTNMYIHTLLLCLAAAAAAAAATTEHQVSLLWHTFRWRSCASWVSCMHACGGISGRRWPGWRQWLFMYVCMYIYTSMYMGKCSTLWSIWKYLALVIIHICTYVHIYTSI